MYALDANSGREKWKFNAGSALASAAAVNNGRVFFSSYKGTFYAVNLADGKLLWKTQFGEGRDWGLAEWWLGTWDLAVSRGMKPLALNERGFAGAWVKSYGGAPGTGFVYIGLSKWDSEVLGRLAMVAEYRPQEK